MCYDGDTPRLALTAQKSDVSIQYLESLARILEDLLERMREVPTLLLSDSKPSGDRHMEKFKEWNAMHSRSLDECVHDVIYKQVLARPTHEAVSAWDGSLTYRELWLQVQSLAQRLVDLGLGPEDVVPVCFDKSSWCVVAWLAIMEAGAAICPLDVTQPTSRLEALASRLKARILLCSPAHSQKLSSVVEHVVPVSGENCRSPANDALHRLSRAAPENIAYVLWTSGSTGEPKGVIIEHRAYCSGAASHAPTLGINGDSRVLQYASYVFDASILETLTTLMVGATVCIPSEHARLNDLAAVINEMRVNWTLLTPSVISFLKPSMVPRMKHLILGGEAMSQEHLSTWSSIKLLNAYGPAECSVVAVANPDVGLSKEPTLIGRGVGMRCWLVDPANHDSLVPQGCIGELVLEGPNLARGYLDDPQKTKEAFIENPTWSINQDGGNATRKMYKTGDLARFHTVNGTLYFVGRKDTQVKLHGQRVELGEIEHHLENEPSFRQSMVLIPKSGFCKWRLVAVITLQGLLTASTMESAGDLRLVDSAGQEKAEPTIAIARESLSHRLPAFMLPSIWLVVELIPLLKSGKLDRKTVLNHVQDLSSETYSQWLQKGECDEQPATDLENQLRTIWGHVLNLRPEVIGLKQSFLALSGDSISAMMVQSQCKKSGIRVSVQQILRARSITHLASLAGIVSRGIQHEEKIEQDFDLSPIQTMYFDIPRQKGHFNQSVFLRLTQPVQPTLVQQAAKAVVNRHSMLRARFRLSEFDDEWKQRITTDVAGSHVYHSYTCRSKEEAVPLMSKTQASLDPFKGPLFAVDLFNIEGGKQLLFMTAHHLVVDLVSWRVILQDVEELLTTPKSAADVEPSLSFQSWCSMQVENVHKTPLNSVLPANDIPAQSYAYWDMQDQAITYGGVRCEGFELSAQDTTIITTQCHEALRTEMVDVLLASMIHSFAQTFTDRETPTIFNEGHGREIWNDGIDLSRTVGWFTIMYPVYVASAVSGDFFDVLRRVKDFRRALPSRGRPYFASRMLTSKGAKKFTKHWPLEFTFNYLGIYQQLERDDALLVPAEEMAGEARAAGGNADFGHDTPRFGLFEISAVIAQGKLRFSFTYDKHMKHQESIRSWITTCKDTLSTMPSRLTEMAHQPTLSDFPFLSLTYDDLKQLTEYRLPRLGVSNFTNVEDIYRCSQIQQGLLISRQRDAGIYAIESVYKVNSKDGSQIVRERVAQAWQSVVDRHASLRTLFVDSLSQEEALYDQIVLKNVRADIVYLDTECDSSAIEVLKAQQPAEYDDHAPQHRLTLCKAATGGVFCKFEFSHTIIDGASLSTIFQELILLYEGRFLPEVGPLYKDYIAFLQNQPPQAGIGYWKSYLADAKATTFPVLDDGLNPQRVLHSKRLALNDVTHVQKFCSLHGLTLANIFHTAWALTLRAYTGLEDVAYGYLMSTRDETIKDVDGIVGYLVNMLVCRVVFDPENPIVGVMQQVQTDLSASQTHRHTALAEVLHTLDLSGASLFNTSLSYRKVPLAASSVEHTTLLDECFPYYDPTEYDVSINIEVSGEHAAIDLDYWTDCLSDGHASNVANTFLQAVENILTRSELAVWQLSTISIADQQQIIEWNSSMPESINECVHDVVAQQMMLRPEAPAIRAWDADFTYAELDAGARRLASHLTAAGVGPGRYVCLCFEKSAFTIVSMLGVLHAGAAFVSLDPMNPTAALELRINDTEARVILTSPCFSSIFEDMGPRVISVNQVFLDGLRPIRNSIRPTTDSSDPCCVIYTSGSTGQPKGVILEHRNLVSSSYAHGSAIGIDSNTRFLQFASYTFDNNLEEIFTTLMRGGAICVPSEHDRFNDLAGAVSRLGANFMDLTPTVATYLNPSEMPTIKGLVLGGEALTKTVLEVWGGTVDIYNMYGPSECTINSTCRPGITKSSDPLNLGRSIGSVSWIVDAADCNRLVAIGCEGELLIEGPILARGYLKKPEKTSEVFITDPAWDVDLGQRGRQDGPRRFYKTGDLVRYNSDGTLCYLGRKDQQIKLNGQRIELGEIEYHVGLNLQDDWHFAVDLITPGSNPTTSKALAVFVRPGDNDNVHVDVLDNTILSVTSDLQEIFRNLEVALTSALPKHMVPSLFIPLARLPLSSAGKLDRKQLRAIAKSIPDRQLSMFRLAGSSGRSPSSEVEKTLAQLWESALHLEPGSVGMDAQYFRLGGDSIAAIRLVSAARALGISLTVANVFRNATLSQMCETSSMSTESSADLARQELRPFELIPAAAPADQVVDNVAKLCQVDPKDVEDIYPCASLQEGLVALSSKQPGAYVGQTTYHLSSLDVNKFKEAWESVVAAEAILRTRVVYMENLGFLQVVVKEAMTWVEHKSLAEVPDSARHMPAYNGAALSGYSLVQEPQGDVFFVLFIHHALYDGWSMELMLEKVRSCYHGHVLDNSVSSPPYANFIRYLSDADTAGSENFWKARLEGTTSPQFPALPQPTYLPHVTGLMSHTMSISREPGAETTMPTLIRAAWALTVSTFTDSEDVVFAETINGRDAPVSGILDTVGPTFATIPVRVHPERHLSISDYLQQLRDDVGKVMPHQYTGLQRIKRISADTATACDFQNLILISGENQSINEDFWKPLSTESEGTDFFTYALTVNFEIAKDELRMIAHFDPEVIPEWQCKKLLGYCGHFVSCLNGSNEGASTLRELSVLTKEDETCISQWNEDPPIVIDQCIHDLIHKRARTVPPSTPAICSWDARLSYRELDNAADSLAVRLQAFGIKRGSFVPICFEKSTAAIVAMLAIMKLGASLVAIDGEFPQARLQSIISDVEAEAVVCSPKFDEVCTSLGVRRFVLDLQSILNGATEHIALLPCSGDSVAFVVFTSGSTGKPKGTPVPHSAFCSSAVAHGPAMRINPQSRVLQFAAYTFDVSMAEIFTTLILGGCVCTPDEDTRLNNIAKTIRDMDVNWAYLTPSVAQTVLPSDVPSLETLVLGAEAVTHNNLATWANKTHLVEAYGPSECAVYCTVNPHLTSQSHPNNIGWAVGCRCFVVNQHCHDELVPIGAVGELVIVGPIVAQGYLKNPAKTQESFIRSAKWMDKLDFFKDSASRLMYKSGDLVRYAEDGSFLYLDRKDNQVKLHGQRVELGDIEHHIGQLATIQHCLAMIPAQGPYHKKLVGVLSLREAPQSRIVDSELSVITATEAAPTVDCVRKHLSKCVAPYMIPSNWVILQEIPLLTSGKLDRKRLLRWVENMNEDVFHAIAGLQNVEDESQGSEVQESLRAIWSNVLNLPLKQVVLSKGFLAMGGDSISALQVSSKCRNEGLGVSVKDIIRCQSILDLSSRVTLPQNLIYAPEQYDQPFNLAPIQRLFFDWVGKEVNHLNQSVTVKVSQRHTHESIAAAVKALVVAHSMLRARFERLEQNTWTQRLDKDPKDSYRFRAHPGQHSMHNMSTVIESSQKGLNIETGPIFSVDLFDSGDDGSQIIALVAHHLVIDVVSWGIILDDLENLLRHGKIATQPTMPFQTWSSLQEARVVSEALKESGQDITVPGADYSFWSMSDLPNTYSDVATLDFELGGAATEQLLGPCNNAYETEIVDILLGSILFSFRRSFPDRTSLPAAFNEAHGREPWDSSLDLSRTVGWFTTISPVAIPDEAGKEQDLTRIIRWIKDQRSRSHDKGRQSFAHRMLSPHDQKQFENYWPMEIVFNYLGHEQAFKKTTSLLQPLDGPWSDSDIESSVPRLALFEISASVVDGRLKISFDYNRKMARQSGIQTWVSEFEKTLLSASDQLQQLEPQKTLSSFPLLPATFGTLDVLQQRLAAIGISTLDELDDVYGCSPMQQGILLSQLRDSGRYMYRAIFSASSISPTAKVDPGRLAQAWTAMVQKHTSLRTVFIDSLSQEGIVDQAVLKRVSPKITWTRGGAAQAVETLEDQEPIKFVKAQTPHALTICETGGDKIFCKLEISHALCDGTSIPIVFEELASHYAGLTDHSNGSLAYRDYLLHIKQSSTKEDLSYWRHYLESVEPCSFPTLADVKEGDHELLTLELRLQDISPLKAFCAKNEITLSNVLQLVWALVLRTYTGSDSVCFGYLTSGRNVPLPSIDSAIGLFISMLVCRIDCSDGLVVSKALEQIKDDYAQSTSHQAFSLAELQHKLQLSGRSLFNTAFTFQRRTQPPEDRNQTITFDVLDAYDPSEFDLTVNVESLETEIVVDFNYWTHCLSETAAMNLSETFSQILDSILKPQASSQTIGSLDICSESQRQLIYEWNKKPLPMVDECVHSCIQTRQRSMHPSTPAVCSWDVDLSYEKLISISQCLAQHLRSLGVGPEVYVPLCFEKTTWAVVAMLGVLQAGGAFVPLEPSHPDDRIEYIINNVNAQLILASTKYGNKFANFSNVTTFVVDESLTKVTPSRLAGTATPTTPENAAYLIFTSGTTGLPKGTIVSHRAFATSATEHSAAILMRRSSRVLQFSNLCFDASVMEILTTLMTGGCICIPSDEERMNDLPGAINRMRVNWTLLTPSVATGLKPENVPSLRVLVTGGEAMQAKEIVKWEGKASLVNAYGPSECAVIATTSTKIDEIGRVIDNQALNIGHAVGCRSWVVSPQDHNQLLPIGSVGELVLQGNTVARGYLKMSEKTAKAFVAPPAWMTDKSMKFGHNDNETIYKTGDLVRYRSDGSILYVSRKDTQIKLNGLRIELGEIEHRVKERLPSNMDTAVEMVAPAGRRQVLALFFSAWEDGEAISADVKDENAKDSEDPERDPLLTTISEKATTLCKALKADLGGSLPAYMIPTLYVPLRRLPWTPSGKLDRRRLAQIVCALPKDQLAPFMLASSGEQHVPVDGMERRLQGLWERVLHLEPKSVALEDLFFVLGGDSVAAMRLVAAARAEKIALSVLDIFRKPSLRDMAQACGDLDESVETVLKPFGLLSHIDSLDDVLDEVSAHCAVQKEHIADAYPCTALQEGLMTMSIKQPGAYVARNVFILPEAVDLDQFRSAWQRALEDMEILRTRIVHTTSSGFVQVVLERENIEWHSAKTLEDVMEAPSPIPAHNGSPLMELTIIVDEMRSQRYFVWAIQHSLYDGWSMPKMLQRVEDIYFEDSPPPPTATYSQFIRYLSQTNAEACNQFWQTKFRGLSSSHFPSDSSVSTGHNNSNEILPYIIQLPEKQSNTGITLPSTIRAAWGILMAAHTGSHDVVFGETMTGRNVPIDGIIDILGPTLTTVPTRIQVSPALTAIEYLQKVHEMATDVIPFQHVGLQQIRRLGEEAAAACDFQNLLVIQTAGEASAASDASKLWDPQDTGVGASFFTYPLVLELNTEGSSIHVDAHYNERVISNWHVQRLLFQLESILGQLCVVDTNDTTRVEDIQTISNQDLASIRQWNNYKPSVVKKCIQDLFLDQAKLSPHANAVAAWDGDFSYTELKYHALCFSKSLKYLGVAPEVLVPFCMDKSRWALVAQMGILLAGGAIVPLDPAHPVDRHAEIIKDTEATIMVCSPAYQERYADLVKTIVPVDQQTMTKRHGDDSTTRLTNQATSANTAYVIFTSGSTGRPKGVVVQHEAFCTSSFAYSKAMMMEPHSRVFNFASVTFDVGLMENLSPLTMGACVCVPNNEQKTSDLGAAIDSLHATWAFLTPSVANLIEPAMVPSLKVLVCGGEAMSKETILRWADDVLLVNGYGPTEASVISVVNSKVSKTTDPANTGVAHANGYAWISEADNHDRLAPLGCVGELLLEGPLLAREYLHDKEKTSKAFINNPSWSQLVSATPGLPRRIYKTGDLVKYNSDGTIHFNGRKDNQIKLNGQRMELGEVEHKLSMSDQIQHAVALLPKAGFFKQRLIAVVSMSQPRASNKSSGSSGCAILQGEELKQAREGLEMVREFLSEKVPPYMMPTFYIPLQAIPIMVSGKLDRKQVEKAMETLDEATCKRVTDDEESHSSEAAPITETIQTLREVWAAVFNLPVDDVDPSRSFMSQGGDSLSAMFIIARCRKQGIIFSLREVLQAKSLFQLAKTVDAKGMMNTSAKTSANERIDESFELSPVQSMYFHLTGSSNEHAGDFRFNQSQIFHLKRRTEPETLRKAVETLVQQHSMFRVRFVRDAGNKWCQKIVADALTSYRFGVHQVDSPNELLRLIAVSQRSLNIESGPLLAVELFNSQQYGQVLSLVAHHLVIDVVSWGIVCQQLEDLLASEAEVPEKPMSYQVWLTIQNEQATKRDVSTIKKVLPFNVRRADMKFWDMGTRANLYGDILIAGFELDKAVTGLALGASNNALRTQPLEILITALLSSFRSVFAGRSCPTIYNETHGRDVGDLSADVTGTIGWFTSIYPITIPSNEAANVNAIETLKRAKDLRRSLPSNGREYFAHRYLTPDGRWRFSDHMPMEIILNYTGQSRVSEQSDSLLQPFALAKSPDEEMFTADVGSKMPRMALFEIGVSVLNDEMQFSFIWNKHMAHQNGIRQWISKTQSTFKELVGQLANFKPEPTLSDYPLLPTDYKGLKTLSDETFRKAGVSSLDEVEDLMVCAPTQEGLLLSQIRNPHQYQLNVVSEASLAQPNARMDVPRLVKAWQKVVDHHQSLRATFVYSVCKGHAFDQIVLKWVDGGAKVIHCKDDEFLEALSKISLHQTNSKRRLQLSQQLSICTTDSGKCYTKLELNHAVIDGGSGSIIMRDLASAYENRLDGERPLYSNYIRFIANHEGDSDIAYWKDYLNGVERCHIPPLNPGPKDQERLNHISLRYDRFAELNAFCRANELTLSNVFLVGWALVLREYVSRADICFGNVTAGREAPVDGIQDTVGAFINMLVCRVGFSSTKTLKDVIRTVQSDYLEALPHQHCALAKVQHDLGFSGEPLFNTAISIQNQLSTRDAEKEGDAIDFRPIDDHDPTEVCLCSILVQTKAALIDNSSMPSR